MLEQATPAPSPVRALMRFLVLPVVLLLWLVILPLTIRGAMLAVAMVGWAMFIGIINTRWTELVTGEGGGVARNFFDSMSVWGGIGLLVGCLPMLVFVLWRPDKVLFTGPDRGSFTTMSLAGGEPLETERHEPSRRLYINWVRITTVVALLPVLLQLSL